MVTVEQPHTLRDLRLVVFLFNYRIKHIEVDVDFASEGAKE